MNRGALPPRGPYEAKVYTTCTCIYTHIRIHRLKRPFSRQRWWAACVYFVRLFQIFAVILRAGHHSVSKHGRNSKRARGGSRSRDWRGPYGERGARAHNGGLGALPPAGSRGIAPGQGGEAPLKLNAFRCCHMSEMAQNCYVYELFMAINGSCSTNMCARQLSFIFSSMVWAAWPRAPPFGSAPEACIGTHRLPRKNKSVVDICLSCSLDWRLGVV